MLKKIVKFIRKSKTGDNVIVFLIMTAVMAVIAVTVSTSMRDQLVGEDNEGGTLGKVLETVNNMESEINLEDVE